jgi:dTDP-4-dehydrorhamnose reductase
MRGENGPLQMWAGLECTVNRVGDRFSDQLIRTGHDNRLEDLDRLAELQVKVIRYPALWERHDRDPQEWNRTFARLDRLRSLGMRPIVGLLHHGSGPPFTSLIDPAFPDHLARFAGQVAERFPWVDSYIPVNEPLTTARFSGLYGHWYPHGKDDRTFVRCLLNECRGVILSMKAIRAVRSDATLVQTEDLGQVHAPRHLQYQADFENERRWLTWDLLCGRVSRRHSMYRYLLESGATEDELEWFLEHRTPPNLIGVNHYITSERYLDDRLEFYRESQIGGNGRARYADTEAVRVLRSGGAGLRSILRQTWSRYLRPMAVTEAHLGCTPDEQVRWLWHVWEQALSAREAGAQIRAVTSWAAFGTFDWDSLVTRETGNYEPGAFDVRHDPPAPTKVAELIRALAQGGKPDLACLDAAGWWNCHERLIVAPPPRPRRERKTLMQTT